MKNACKAAFFLFLLVVTSSTGGMPQATNYEVRRLPLPEAKRVIEAYAQVLPQDLPLEATRSAEAWTKYVDAREAELRLRLEQGDLDTLANLLLFGTSFTEEPLLTPAVLLKIAGGANESHNGSPADAPGIEGAYQRRLRDLAMAIAYPGENKRLQYFQTVLKQRGFRFETAADYNRLGSFLASNLVRMLNQNSQLAGALQRFEKESASSEFEARSQVFEHRGISLDTSIFPNFAVEQALRQLRETGVIQSGKVRRVAIVGPGLDTVNKDVGFDYYPEQTIQPFAVVDSLLRLGLASETQLKITTLDISQRVNAHIQSAQKAARKGTGYQVQLPIRSDIHWTQGSLNYWEKFGSAIGEEAKPVLPPAGAGGVRTRSVRIRPGIVLRILVRHLDVVHERLVLPEAERFDLIVGTNVFVYYGSFEQALAELNLSAMLRENGIVLTNDALPTGRQPSAFRELGFSTTGYSDRPKDGDRIIWLQKQESN